MKRAPRNKLQSESESGFHMEKWYMHVKKGITKKKKVYTQDSEMCIEQNVTQ